MILSGARYMRRLLLSIALLTGLSGVAFGQTSPASEIAPGGKLRVGMIAITVLSGVAEPVARFIGQKLGAAVEPVMYPNPDAYLQSFGKGEWDIAIGPRVLAPADKADSTADLWAISLVYVAAPGTEFPDIASVDKAGVKIGTIRGAPSDRVLTREIKAAEIVRIPLSPTIAADAADLLRSRQIRLTLKADASHPPDLAERILRNEGRSPPALFHSSGKLPSPPLHSDIEPQLRCHMHLLSARRWYGTDCTVIHVLWTNQPWILLLELHCYGCGDPADRAHNGSDDEWCHFKVR